MTHKGKRLSERNRCMDAGFRNQMIGFIKMHKIKPDGKPFWRLLNEDLSCQVHKNKPAFTEIRDIKEKEEEEKEKPTVRPSIEDNSYSTNDKDEMMFHTCLVLKDFAKILKNSELYMGVK
jgi:hypothetical protein